MKALSIRQPWAWMIATGEKTIETRTWRTDYRGELLIVSSKGKMTRQDITAFNIDYPGKSTEILYGKALATCRLVRCRKMTVDDENAACCKIYPGAYSWVLRDINKIEPFDVGGQLSLYDVEMPIEYKGQILESHVCPHCGKPTVGAVVLMPGETKKTRLKMCQDCWDYIGSSAAAQPGATMTNRLQMERKLTNIRW